MRPDDTHFMQLAIRQAHLALERGGGEVGCVIVRGGEIVAEGFNEGEIEKDPTAHAEIVTLRRAGKRLQKTDLSGCALYSTLQPCGMCTLACIWANISRIVYGATRHDVASKYFDERHLNTIDFVRDAFRENIEVVGGVLAEECSRFYVRR
jgi:tRNA(adenine34) deaminase